LAVPVDAVAMRLAPSRWQRLDDPTVTLDISAFAGRRMHVNLLRYNPTGLSLQGRTYAPSTMEQTEAFLAELRAQGTVAHLRRARGPDIDAACGQLRRRAAAMG
jgi:adenine C2-methylase RlmN of 23S rRNA A2503 and tRNA A37